MGKDILLKELEKLAEESKRDLDIKETLKRLKERREKFREVKLTASMDVTFRFEYNSYGVEVSTMIFSDSDYPLEVRKKLNEVEEEFNLFLEEVREEEDRLGLDEDDLKRHLF